MMRKVTSKSFLAKHFNDALSGATSPWSITDEGVKDAGFSPFVAFCFAINYILGTGFLTVPWAFVQGGLALSSIILVIVCVISDIAKDYILETMARAEAILDHEQQHKYETKASSLTQDEESSGEEVSRLLVGSATETASGTTGAAESKLQDGNPNRVDYDSIGTACSDPHQKGKDNSLFVPSSSDESSTMTKSELYMVKDRKFEMNTLCLIFLGRKGLNVYTLFLALYIYGALWAFTSVFASAMASVLPIASGDNDELNYTIHAIIFGLIVVPITCMELNEQVAAQVFLTICRFLIIFFMVGTSTYCSETYLFEEEESLLVAPQQYSQDGDESSSDITLHRALSSLSSSAMLFRPMGLHKMLPVLLFSNIYHFGIPAISHHVADKTKLGPIFRSACVFICVSFLCIGFVLGSTFGDNVEQAANLNWNKILIERGMIDGGRSGAPWWMVGISLFIICFPALDVISAFPLNAITLGNNMMSAFYGLEIHEAEKNRWVVTVFRLLAGIPPIILAIFVRELGVITDYAGTTGFIITFSFPAMLYIRSKIYAENRQLSTMTYYTTYASSDYVAFILFFFGIAMVLFVIFEVIVGY